uniref:Uncharacterized protein n=1 Tax=Oryza sativa subsp. japonica TaxID=39947 RepID=Q2QX97_ORYSJ|nr:hypothetical protein LOC_Os12g06770 [Oryza sativa Japonica Group]
MAGGHRHVDSKGKAGAEEQRTIYSSEQEEGEKLLIMAPFKINKTIAATFFMVLIMSCALTSTSACQGGTECTVEEPHCTMDSCREKCKDIGHQPQVQPNDS